MQIHAIKENFQSPLDKAAGVIEVTPLMPVLSNVKITAHESGQITMFGTDMEVESTVNGKTDVARPGGITVRASRLRAIVASMPAHTTFTMNANEGFATIIFGRSRYKLNTLPSHDFPDKGISEPTGTLSVISIPAHTLKGMLQAVMPAVSNNSLGGSKALECLRIEVEAGRLYLVGTDARRMHCAHTTVGKNTANSKALVSKKAITSLVAALGSSEDDVTLTLSDNSIELDVGDEHIAANLVTGQYVEWRSVLKDKLQGQYTVKLHTKGFIEAVARAALVFDAEQKRKNPSVKIDVGKNMLSVHVDDGENTAREEVKAIDGPESFQVHIDPSLLLDALNSLPVEHVEMVMDSPDDGVVLRFTEADQGKRQWEGVAVVSPVRK